MSEWQSGAERRAQRRIMAAVLCAELGVKCVSAQQIDEAIAAGEENDRREAEQERWAEDAWLRHAEAQGEDSMYEQWLEMNDPQIAV